MIIGFIGFGKVSQNLFRLIGCEGFEFITSLENRSPKTGEAIGDFDIDVLPTFEEVASRSDLLISANSPGSSLEVAQRYGGFCNGIYLDLNNVSPQTTLKMASHASDFVDGAIIGKIDSPNPTMYVSGENAEKLLFLNDFLNVKVISKKIGDAAILKLLRSSYTKTLSALLIESYSLARQYGLEDEFFDVLTLTEGDDFKEKSLSRISNSLNNSKRKREELDEIMSCFDSQELIMIKAASEKFRRF